MKVLSEISKGQKAWFKLTSNEHFRLRFLFRLKVFHEHENVVKLAFSRFYTEKYWPRGQGLETSPPGWAEFIIWRINIWPIRGLLERATAMPSSRSWRSYQRFSSKKNDENEDFPEISENWPMFKSLSYYGQNSK